MKKSQAPSNFRNDNMARGTINSAQKAPSKATEGSARKASKRPAETPPEDGGGRGRAGQNSGKKASARGAASRSSRYIPDTVEEEREEEGEEKDEYEESVILQSEREVQMLFNPSDSEDEASQPIVPTRRTNVITTPFEEPTQLDKDGEEDGDDEENNIEGDQDGEESDNEGDFVEDLEANDQNDEEDLDREIPDIWNHPTDLTMDKLELYNNEVEQMIKVVDPKEMVKALYTLSCSVVFDFVSAQHPTMSTSDLAFACTETFRNHMSTFPLKAYARENLLTFFPGSTWPIKYVQFVNKEMAKKPTKSQLQSAAFAGVPQAQHKALRFGMAVKKMSLDTKAFVNMHLGPNYKPEEELPSGHTKEQLLRGIRSSLWAVEAHTKATNAMRAAAHRRKSKDPPIPEPPLHQLKIAFETARVKTFRKFNNNYYPREFLVFLLFGLPALNPLEILSSLNGGDPGTEGRIDPTATAPELGSDDDNDALPGGRNARRARAVAAANQGRGAGGGRAAGTEVAGGGGRGGGRAGRAGAAGAAAGPAQPQQLQVSHVVTVQSDKYADKIDAIKQLQALNDRKTTLTAEQKELRRAELDHQLELLLEAKLRDD